VLAQQLCWHVEASVGGGALGQRFEIELGQLVEAAPMQGLAGIRDAEALQ
jgi:hypothetical protein